MVLDIGGVQYYDVPEIVTMLHASRWAVWKWIREKHLPAVKLGRRYLVRCDEFQRFIESKRTVKQAQV